MGTNDYLTINHSGTVHISGSGAPSISSQGLPLGGGNLRVSGNIALTTGLIFDYNNMPSADPEILGVVWRDGSNIMGGGTDSLFVSAG